MSTGQQRLWAGPLFLILVIALIYIFSLMPNAPAHKDYLREPVAAYGYPTDRRTIIDVDEETNRAPPAASFELASTECENGGRMNNTSKSCECPRGFHGQRCDIDIGRACRPHGFYNASKRRCDCKPFAGGSNCGIICTQGIFNTSLQRCDCPPRVFGHHCEHLCKHGRVLDGICHCDPGFSGHSCKCGEGDCETRRRAAVNSRLTLSGLSFCVITIGLLCVTARRRRSAGLPPSDDNWYRVFQPAAHRPTRCRHEFLCGGTWIPRDRALLVAPGRASITHNNNNPAVSASTSSNNNASSRISRIRRSATPPPRYCSTEQLDASQPPTYEEATRALEAENERREIVVDETQSVKDEQETMASILEVAEMQRTDSDISPEIESAPDTLTSPNSETTSNLEAAETERIPDTERASENSS